MLWNLKLSLKNIYVEYEDETLGTLFYSEKGFGNFFQWIDTPDQVKRNSLNLGICIPDSCSASDLQTSLQSELDKVFLQENFKAVVQVDPIMCTVSGDMYPYNTAYYITR